MNINKNIVIKKIEIGAFGKLCDYSITPSERVNIVNAPNETGKSTLVAFIKFVFYGFTTGKMKEISENDKKRGIPWGKNRAFGAVEISAGDKPFRIERVFALPSSETVTVRDMKTGQTVMSGACPGEEFFGINAATFEKTLMFGQYSALTSNDEELSESVQALMFSGDEQTDAVKAAKKLCDLKRELKSQRGTGIIPDMKATGERFKSEYDEAVSQMIRIDDITRTIGEVNTAIARNRSDSSRLEKELKNIERYNALIHITTIDDLVKSEAAAKAAYEAKAAEFAGGAVPETESLDRFIETSTAYSVASANSDAAKRKYEEDQAQYKSLCDRNIENTTGVSAEELVEMIAKHKKKITVGSIACAASALLTVVGFIVSTVVGIVASVILAACVVFLVLSGVSQKKFVEYSGFSSVGAIENALRKQDTLCFQAERAKESMNDSLEKFKAAEAEKARCEKEASIIAGNMFVGGTSPDFAATVKIIKEAISAVSSLKGSWTAKKEALEIARKTADSESLREQALGATKPDRTSDEVERQLKYVQNGEKLLEEKILTLEKEKAGLSATTASPSLLFGKAMAAEAALKKAERKYAVLTEAIDILGVAGEYMKGTVSPKIAAYASELFSKATGGKYTGINISNDFAITFKTADDEKSAEYLSAGAKATAYVCVRLAIIKLIYGEKMPPIIFDDAFVRMDDKRLNLCVKTILETLNGQIFVFSCTEREREAFENNSK